MNKSNKHNSVARIVADSMVNVAEAALGDDLDAMLAAYEAHALLLNAVALSDRELSSFLPPCGCHGEALDRSVR
ncbi:hypothetical protein [Burkholderia contaminans]|uniref:hypothetical protein n=1 Tax=Burkholderia contaminans TaxID=488447 RepID=UPI0015894ED6|nr:hypothetical protein [Burkholderia contaminans]